MKGLSITTFALILVTLVNAQQIPQYSMVVNLAPPQLSWLSGGPMDGHTGSRTQVLYYPSEFPTMPSGYIQRIYVRSDTDLPYTFYYKNLLIRMGNMIDEGGQDSSFRTSPPYVTYPVDTVFFSAQYTITAPVDSGDWVPFTFTKPFYYNGVNNFIVDFMQDSTSVPIFGLEFTGFSDNLPGNRSYSVSHKYTVGQGWSWVNTAPVNFVQLLGFDLTPTSVTAVNDVKGPTLYPNPFRSTFNLRAERSGTLRVSDIYGRNIASYTVSSGNNELSMPPSATDGMYVGRYFTEEGELVRTIRMSYSR